MSRGLYFGTRRIVELLYPDERVHPHYCKLIFAQRLVQYDEIPDNCWYCWFCGSVSCFLLRVKREHEYTPICSVYDFAKYVLEKI